MGPFLKHLLTLSNIIALLTGAVVATVTMLATRDDPKEIAKQSVEVIRAQTCQKLNMALVAAYERTYSNFTLEEGIKDQLVKTGCNLPDQDQNASTTGK